MAFCVLRPDFLIVRQVIERCAIERLQQKTEPVFTELEQNKNNWELTFYHLLAKNYGSKIRNIQLIIVLYTIDYKKFI